MKKNNFKYFCWTAPSTIQKLFRQRSFKVPNLTESNSIYLILYLVTLLEFTRLWAYHRHISNSIISVSVVSQLCLLRILIKPIPKINKQMKRKFNKEENPKITKRNTKSNYKNYIEFNLQAATLLRKQESLLFVMLGAGKREDARHWYFAKLITTLLVAKWAWPVKQHSLKPNIPALVNYPQPKYVPSSSSAPNSILLLAPFTAFGCAFHTFIRVSS